MADTIPWVEKYRPTQLESVVLNELLQTRLQNLDKFNMPNLLFYGPPGTGKTTTALALVRKILVNKDNYIELNASDNRGINMITNFVQSFCKSKGEENIKIIILDEADNITKKAQERLINFVENYPYVKFIFTCNDVTAIIESLQSRCCMVKFQQPNLSEIKSIVKKILANEKIKFEPKVLQNLILHSDYDIRKSINNLEAIYNLYNKITPSTVDKYFCKPTTYTVLELIHNTLTADTPQAPIEKALEMINSGMNILDLVVGIITILQDYHHYERYFELLPIQFDTGVKVLEIAHRYYYIIVQTTESRCQLIRLIYEIFEIRT